MATAAFVCVFLAVLVAQYLPGANAGRLLLQSGNLTTNPASMDLSSNIEGSLLVGDGEQLGKVTVIDLATGGVNETLQIGNSSTTMFASASGRYAYILQYNGDKTSIYDGQYALEFNGDHWHADQESAPGLIPLTLEYDAPTHLTTHRRTSVLYNDEAGMAVILDETRLSNSTYTPSVIQAGRQHGFIVPMNGRHVAIGYANETAANEEEAALAVGVQVYLQNGTVVYSAAQRDCPELHGSAGNGNTALFACSNGVLVITYNRSATPMFSHTKIPYPSPDARAYEIYGLDKYTTFFASSYGAPPDYASVGIHLLDPVALEATLVVNASAEGEVIAAVFDPAGDFLAVLTAGADGTLILLNPLTGAELRRATGVLMNGGTAAFDIEDEIWPSLQVGLGRIYIAIPSAGVVNEHHQDSFELLRALPVGGSPSGLVVLGPVRYWDEFYQH